MKTYGIYEYFRTFTKIHSTVLELLHWDTVGRPNMKLIRALLQLLTG
jgi:hypothetical protein